MIKAQLTRMRKYKSFFSKIRNKRGLLTFITFIQIELVLLNCSPREESWECLGLQDWTSQSQRKSILNIHWKDWCWSWSSNPLAAWCKELLTGKDPDAGKDWRGQQRVRWLDGIIDSKDMNLSKLREIVEDRGAGHVAVHGVAKSQTWLSDWITAITTEVLATTIRQEKEIKVIQIKEVKV